MKFFGTIFGSALLGFLMAAATGAEPALTKFKLENFKTLVDAQQKLGGLPVCLKVTIMDVHHEQPASQTFLPSEATEQYSPGGRAFTANELLQRSQKSLGKEAMWVRVELVNKEGEADEHLKGYTVELRGVDSKGPKAAKSREIAAAKGEINFSSAIREQDADLRITIVPGAAEQPPATPQRTKVTATAAQNRLLIKAVGQNGGPYASDWQNLSKTDPPVDKLHLIFTYGAGSEAVVAPLRDDFNSLRNSGSADSAASAYGAARVENATKEVRVRAEFGVRGKGQVQSPRLTGGGNYWFKLAIAPQGAVEQPKKFQKEIVIKPGDFGTEQTLYVMLSTREGDDDAVDTGGKTTATGTPKPTAGTPTPPSSPTPSPNEQFKIEVAARSGAWVINEDLYSPGGLFLTKDEFAKICRGEKVEKPFQRDTVPQSAQLLNKNKFNFFAVLKEGSKDLERITSFSFEKRDKTLMLAEQPAAFYFERAVANLSELNGYKVNKIDARTSTVSSHPPAALGEPKPYLFWDKLDATKTEFAVELEGPGSKKTQLGFTVSEAHMKELLKKPRSSFAELVAKAEPKPVETSVDLLALLNPVGTIAFMFKGSKLDLLDKASKDPKGFLHGLEAINEPKRPVNPSYNPGAKENGILLVVDNYGPWENYEGLKQNIWAAAADALAEVQTGNDTVLAAGIANQRFDKLLTGDSLKRSVTRLEGITFNESRGLENGHYPVEFARMILGEGNSIQAKLQLSEIMKEAKAWKVVVVLPPPRFNRESKIIDPIKVEDKAEQPGAAPSFKVLSSYVDGLDKPISESRPAIIAAELEEKRIEIRYLVFKTNQTPSIEWSSKPPKHEDLSVIIIPNDPKEQTAAATKTVSKDLIKKALSKLLE